MKKTAFQTHKKTDRHISGLNASSKPLVSIIIPTHNGSMFIQRAVNSVLNQTYSPLELIVVDDNGRGNEEQVNTERQLQHYIEEKKLRYLVHDEHQNGSAARNTGARVAMGEFLAFLDDDDEYPSERIRESVSRLNELDDSYALVYHSRIIYDATKTPEKYKKTQIAKRNGFIAKYLLLNRSTINTNTFLIRKSNYCQIDGFDESFLRHQDYEFSVRVASRWKVSGIRTIGAISHKYYRNEPKDKNESFRNMVHYIDKMLPYINNYSLFTRNLIISTRIFRFYRTPFEKMYYKHPRAYVSKLIQNYRECKVSVKKWIPHYNFFLHMVASFYYKFYVK